MKIATILFTYNRPTHTKQVLDALKKNTIIPEKLLVFHDGIKENTDTEKWNEVEKIIRDINWCDAEVHTMEYNKGLADSVIDGVTYALKMHEAVIVLEDDCIPQPLFMEYMLQSLEKYEHEKSVYSIGGTAEPIDVPANGTDAYFIGRINSWGWATWRDRWAKYVRDYRMFGRIKKDKELGEWLSIWGQDLEPTLIGNIRGETDSWAVFWALCVIKEHGLCLAPYHSYVENVGFDGSGVHCGSVKPDFKIVNNSDEKIILPDKIEVVDNYKTLFRDYYPWINPVIKERYYKQFLLNWRKLEQAEGHLVDFFVERNINSISVWGLGYIGEYVIDELKNYISIDNIVLTVPTTEMYHDIPIISVKEKEKIKKYILVIPGYDIELIKRKINDESKEAIPLEQLTFNPLCVDVKKHVEMSRMGNEYGGFYLYTPSVCQENNIVYSFGIGEDLSFSEDILKMNHSARVYAFDPTPKSAEYVKKHELSQCDRFSYERIGLSNEKRKTEFYLPENEQYVSGSELMHKGLKDAAIEVQMDILENIAEEKGQNHINILKMDIEGSEFAVIESMKDITKLEIDQICVEVHDRFVKGGRKKLICMNRTLHDLGYILIYISKTGEELTYIKQTLYKGEIQ